MRREFLEEPNKAAIQIVVFKFDAAGHFAVYLNGEFPSFALQVDLSLPDRLNIRFVIATVLEFIDAGFYAAGTGVDHQHLHFVRISH
jgi:hypothetical protein